jgi:hypothetical protein
MAHSESTTCDERWCSDEPIEAGYSLVSVSQWSNSETLLGSIDVKAMPIPENSREYATLPWAANTVVLCKIRIETFVPSTNGVTVSTKQPNRLKSSMCAAT